MTNICTKVTVRKRPIKTVSCRYIWILSTYQTPGKQADRQEGNISAYTFMPTRQRNLKRSSQGHATQCGAYQVQEN